MVGGGRVLIGTSLLWVPLSAVSDGVTTLVLPVRLGADGSAGSAGALGLITFAGLIAGTLVQPLMGDLSDRLRPRIGRRMFLGVGVVLVAATVASLAFVHEPLAVGAAFLALSIALGIAQAPQQALMADLVPPAQRGRASGFKGLADLLGATVGFALLGTLLAGGDVRPAVAVLAASIIGLYVAVIVLLRREPEPPWIEAGPAARSGLRNVFALDLSRDRSFLLATAARFAFLLGIYAVGRFFVAYVADRRGLEAGPAAEVAGGVLAILALITALASLPAGVLSDRFSRPALMVSGAMLALLGIGFFAVAVDVSLMVAGGIAMAAGSALFGVANWATLLDLAPPAEAGRYLGLAQIGTAGAAATAGLFGLFVDAGQAIESGAGFIALFAAAAVATILAAGLAAAIYRPAITLVRQET